MPNNEDPKKEMSIAEEAGLPENWVPIDSTPIVPSTMAAGTNPYGGGSLPPNFNLQPDTLSTNYKGPGIPAVRLMPVQGNPAANAQTQSIVEKAISEIPAAAVVTGTTYTAGNRINITGTVIATTDPVIDGDVIWEIDPGYFTMRDDFGSCIIPSSSSNPMQSEEPWYIAPAASMISLTGGWPYIGGLLFPLTTAKETFTGGTNFLLPWAMQTGSTAANAGWALFDTVGWKVIWEFSFQRSIAATTSVPAPAFSIAQQSFYLGLGNMGINYGASAPSNSNAARPSVFFGLRYDTDPTAPAISDGTFWFEAVVNVSSQSRINTQGNTFNTLIVPTEFTKYRLELEYTTAGTLVYSLFGNGVVVTSSLAVPLYSTAGSTPLSNVDNGIGTINLNDGEQHSFVNGSMITCTGFAVGPPNLNGIRQIVNVGGGSDQVNVILAGTQVTAGQTGAVVTGYPGVFPWFSFGNDTEATPTAGRSGILLDFFSIMWNPGVGGGSGTPTSTKARYF